MAPIIDWYRRWRYGGATGLNQSQNSVRMIIDITAPFLIGYGLVVFLIPQIAPPEMVEVYKFIGSSLSLIAWLCWCMLLIAKRRGDSTVYIPFPQAHFWFPDGQQKTWDLLVVPNGWEKIAEYPDGAHLYRVRFKDRLEYEDPDRPYPDIFNMALWKVPAEWTKAFSRKGVGEFFYEDVYVEHSACENIGVFVIGWKTEDTRVPICVINECSYLYQKVLAQGGKTIIENGIHEADAIYASYMDTLKKANRLEEQQPYLEAEIQRTHSEKPQDVQKLTKKSINRIRNGVTNIMDTSEPLWQKIVNLKTFAMVSIIAILILLASHFWLGFP